MRRSMCALLVSVLLGSPSFAQSPAPSTSVPRVVRLDGQLAPANGLPPAAVETVTLSIYASQSDGSPLWTETQEVRVDAQGRYAVFLGASTAEGIPASVLSGEARWLGIRFARPGEVEQPRVPMTSVPYALRASDADTLGGLPPSAFFRVPAAGKAGKTGTAGTAAGRTLTPLVSTGTANFIGKFTNSVDLTSSVLFENAGRIGLGTVQRRDYSVGDGRVERIATLGTVNGDSGRGPAQFIQDGRSIHGSLQNRKHLRRDVRRSVSGADNIDFEPGSAGRARALRRGGRGRRRRHSARRGSREVPSRVVGE